MKQTNTRLVQLLMLCILILPGALSAADSKASERWERGGMIEKLESGSFVVGGQTWHVKRSARIVTAGKNNSKTRLSDLKVGDYIWFEGRLHKGRDRVDKIIYMPPSSIPH